MFIITTKLYDVLEVIIILKLVEAPAIKYDAIVEYRNSYYNQDDVFPIINQIEKYYTLLDKDVYHYYFLVDETNLDYIIGTGCINPFPTPEFVKKNRGCIGYSIRPNERNKGYGTKILGLLLEKCKAFNLKYVSISCLESNAASKLIIEKHGGEFRKTFVDSKTNESGINYVIKLGKKM